MRISNNNNADIDRLAHHPGGRPSYSGRHALIGLFLSGCVATPPSMASLRDSLNHGNLAQGELKAACQGAREHLRQAIDSPMQKHRALGAARLWVGCEARRGRLQGVDRWRRDLGHSRTRLTPLLGYVEALTRLAQDPGELPRAAELLKVAASQWPAQAEIPYRLGVILLADDRPKVALPWLQKACALKRPWASCQVALAHALYGVGQLKAALGALKTVPEATPNPADIARGRALVALLARRDQRVPAALRARFDKGRKMLFGEKRAADALAYFRELVAGHPQFCGAQVLLGIAHLRLANPGLAMSALEKAARCNPRDANVPFLLGTLYEGRQRLKRAIAYYRAALAIDPFSSRALSRLGGLLRRSGRHHEAGRVYERLGLLEPQSGARLLAGRAHLKAGDLADAERIFRAQIKEEPGSFDAHLRLAQLLLRRLDSAPSADLLRQAQDHAAVAGRIRPKDPQLLKVRERLADH